MKSLKMYGVGSCGPRGFYGTVGGSHKGIYNNKVNLFTVHIELKIDMKLGVV